MRRERHAADTIYQVRAFHEMRLRMFMDLSVFAGVPICPQISQLNTNLSRVEILWRAATCGSQIAPTPQTVITTLAQYPLIRRASLVEWRCENWPMQSFMTPSGSRLMRYDPTGRTDATLIATAIRPSGGLAQKSASLLRAALPFCSKRGLSKAIKTTKYGSFI